MWHTTGFLPVKILEKIIYKGKIQRIVTLKSFYKQKLWPDQKILLFQDSGKLRPNYLKLRLLFSQ